VSILNDLADATNNAHTIDHLWTLQFVLEYVIASKSQNGIAWVVNASLMIVNKCLATRDNDAPPHTLLVRALHLLNDTLLKSAMFRPHVFAGMHAFSTSLRLCIHTIYDNDVWQTMSADCKSSWRGALSMRAVCAFRLQRLCHALRQYKTECHKIGAYAIGELVAASCANATKSVHDNIVTTDYARVHSLMNACVFNLLDVCDEHSINMLAAQLPPAHKPVFAHLHETYRKFHKFTGLI